MLSDQRHNSDLQCPGFSKGIGGSGGGGGAESGRFRRCSVASESRQIVGHRNLYLRWGIQIVPTLMEKAGKKSTERWIDLCQRFNSIDCVWEVAFPKRAKE